jgi:hypothetical protein
MLIRLYASSSAFDLNVPDRGQVRARHLRQWNSHGRKKMLIFYGRADARAICACLMTKTKLVPALCGTQ